jgi:hypothetical protein
MLQSTAGTGIGGGIGGGKGYFVETSHPKNHDESH